METVEHRPTHRLEDVASATPELAEWWGRFSVLCPDMKILVDELEVVDTPEAVRRTGRWDWVGKVGAVGKDGWVWFRRTPPLRQFVLALLQATFGLRPSVTAGMREYLEEGVVQGRTELLDAARVYVSAWQVGADWRQRRCWAIADMESLAPKTPAELQEAEGLSFLDEYLDVLDAFTFTRHSYDPYFAVFVEALYECVGRLPRPGTYTPLEPHP